MALDKGFDEMLQDFLDSSKRVMSVNCDNQLDLDESTSAIKRYLDSINSKYEHRNHDFNIDDTKKFIVSRLKKESLPSGEVCTVGETVYVGDMADRTEVKCDAVGAMKTRITELEKEIATSKPNQRLFSYEELLEDVLKNGRETTDRTGTGAISVFGRQVHYDLTNGFPLITSKRVYWKGVVYELLWFLNGDTNTKYLTDNFVKIWDEWSDENGDLGPVYGHQWRRWPSYKQVEPDKSEKYIMKGYAIVGNNNGKLILYKEIDQIAEIINQIKNRPDSRRLIVNAWNVGDLDDMALPPCHMTFQFNVYDDELQCQLYQRSADMFLGVPFNVASYSLLTHMIAQQTGLRATSFVHTIGNAHIYSNHVDQVKEQLSREPVPNIPQLVIKRKPDSIFDYKFEDFEVENYKPHATIKAKVAV